MKNERNNQTVINAVRENYARIAESEKDNCGCNPSSCCGTPSEQLIENSSVSLGYSAEELAGLPDGADMGLGCGNPQAIAALKPGETVMDLGSGGGIDCFLAARAVGKDGQVIGVDMTAEMLNKARDNKERGNYENVEFRLGEIEHIPAADNTADVIISNCVINLSPDKQQVYDEAYRVLKPGGRLAVSDIVATTELPQSVKDDLNLHSSCISGASLVNELHRMLEKSGFTDIRIKPKKGSERFISEWVSGMNISDFVISAYIEAVKPS
jgi:SAM-dependent methyltransferase